MFRALLDLLKLLETANIAAMPFKGPTLALAAHGHLSLRQFADLDVLIHKCDVPRITQIITASGYHHIRTNEEWAYTKFKTADSGINIGLQWGLAPERFVFPLDIDQLWNRADPINLEGTDVLQPSPEDLIMLLCGDGAKHCWSKLGWIADLNEFVRARSDKLDWDALLVHAKKRGGKRMLLLGLELMSNLMGTELLKVVGSSIGPWGYKLQSSFLMRLSARDAISYSTRDREKWLAI